MATKLSQTQKFPDVVIPSPGEPVRIGGGLGLPHTIDGYNNDPNGGVTYTASASGARIRHTVGVALAITVSGSDVTVTLASTLGVPTSTATAVAALVNGTAAAAALMSAGATGTGAGAAGPSDYVAIASGIQGSHRPPDQALTDRTYALFSGLLQTITNGLQHKAEMLVQASGITVRALPNTAWLSGAGLDEYTYTASPGDLTLLAPFSNNAWHYVYAYNNGGTMAIEASTTAPDATRQQKNADSTRKYIGSFKTSAVGVPSTLGRMIRGHMILDQHIELLVQTDGAGWLGPVSAATKIPPHVSTIDIYGLAFINENGGGAQGPDVLKVRRSGGAGERIVCAVGQATGGVQQQATGIVALPLDATQRFDWNFPLALVGNLGRAQFDLVGWYEG